MNRVAVDRVHIALSWQKLALDVLLRPRLHYLLMIIEDTIANEWACAYDMLVNF